MADMMTNILKLNRLENQQIFPEITEFDLGEQLCECFLQFENVWEKAEIEIDTDIEQDVKVKADILEGAKESIDECVPEEEIEW